MYAKCHGDLHLGNVAPIDGEPVVFDAIEVQSRLRWIDTQNDVSLPDDGPASRWRAALAYCSPDATRRSRETTKGFCGARFSEVYRGDGAGQDRGHPPATGPAEQERQLVEIELVSYPCLAERLTARARRPDHHLRPFRQRQELPGRGTDHTLPALCLRSDVESASVCWADPGEDATALWYYSSDLDPCTYARLCRTARSVVDAGYVAVVDATFSAGQVACAVQRALRAELGGHSILDCDAPVEVLRQRILMRRAGGGNVSDADLWSWNVSWSCVNRCRMQSSATPSGCDRKDPPVAG